MIRDLFSCFPRRIYHYWEIENIPGRPLVGSAYTRLLYSIPRFHFPSSGQQVRWWEGLWDRRLSAAEPSSGRREEVRRQTMTTWCVVSCFWDVSRKWRRKWKYVRTTKITVHEIFIMPFPSASRHDLANHVNTGKPGRLIARFHSYYEWNRAISLLGLPVFTRYPRWCLDMGQGSHCGWSSALVSRQKWAPIQNANLIIV